jgi:hypothetical protein
MPTLLSDVRCWVNSGKHLLAASISPFDPLTDLGSGPCDTAVDFIAKRNKIDGLG